MKALLLFQAATLRRALRLYFRFSFTPSIHSTLLANSSRDSAHTQKC
jgi:hypothetical protein